MEDNHSKSEWPGIKKFRAPNGIIIILIIFIIGLGHVEGKRGGKQRYCGDLRQCFTSLSLSLSLSLCASMAATALSLSLSLCASMAATAARWRRGLWESVGGGRVAQTLSSSLPTKSHISPILRFFSDTHT